MKKDYITIVSGLPRSGTSMMMRAIETGGIEPLIDHIRKADEDNPKGYYEFELVKQVKNDTSWLKQASGKVVKIVYRLLYDLPADYQYRVLFMRRDMTEVLMSQQKMLKRSGKDTNSVTDEQMTALFNAELSRCEKWLAEQSNFKVLYVNYIDMINDSLIQAKRIDDFLGGGLNIEAMAESIDPTLYRNRNQ